MEQELSNALEIQIPLHKIQASLKKQSTQSGTEKGKAVLLCTGSYNPVHNMHIKMFEIAKQSLEQQGIEVVGAYLSPSHDSYVQGKLGKDAINSVHRVEMCNLILASNSWIVVSTWEMAQKQFVDFPYVAKFHRQYISEKFPEEKIQLMYLCGADHALKCGLTSGMWGVTTVCVKRYGSTEELNSTPQKKSAFWVVETQEDFGDVSSTEIRKRLKEKKSVNDLTHPSVAEYLLKKQLIQ